MSLASRRLRGQCRVVAILAILLCGARALPWSRTATATAKAAELPALRVCADPNNLPFTNYRREGFENAVAEVIARQMHRRVDYYWQPQRRGFLRTTLQAHRCDVVMSVPSTVERVRVTRPYYRSTYVFLSRQDRGLDVHSFDDPRLRALEVGIQITGEDYENPPGAQALAARGLLDHVHGYPVYGDYSQPAPQRVIVDAVASGEVDVAVVWGPIAGYFGPHASVPLRIDAVQPRPRIDAVPFTFDLSIGVRRDDGRLGDELDVALRQQRSAIHHILQQFGVPRPA